MKRNNKFQHEYTEMFKKNEIKTKKKPQTHLFTHVNIYIALKGQKIGFLSTWKKIHLVAFLRWISKVLECIITIGPLCKNNIGGKNKCIYYFYFYYYPNPPFKLLISKVD